MALAGCASSITVERAYEGAKMSDKEQIAGELAAKHSDKATFLLINTEVSNHRHMMFVLTFSQLMEATIFRMGKTLKLLRITPKKLEPRKLS